jgi:hypothetical protein
MAHIPEETLEQMLADAFVKVPLGSVYIHYKKPDQQYIVIGHAILESTDEVAVIYKAEYGRQITFIRPINDFLATVSHDGKEIPRFEKVL